MSTQNRSIVYGAGIVVSSFAIAFAAVSSLRTHHNSDDGSLAAANSPPPGMRWIPDGEFVMGSDDPRDHENEHPTQRIEIKGFWLDRHDVTNAEFKKFIDATAYRTTAERPVDWEELKTQLPPGTPKPEPDMLQPGALVFNPTKTDISLAEVNAWWRWVPGARWNHPQGPNSNIDGKDDYPVVQVSWDDAVAYAKWAGKRLPTEPEWEYAAHGGVYGTRFYWGNTFRPDGRFVINTYTGSFPKNDTAEDGYAGSNPWNAFPPNGYGLYDMAGNVWQWTADPYLDHPTPNPAIQRIAQFEVRRVIKGGSFLCCEQYCESYRPSARRGTSRDTASEHVGFRCALSK